MPQLLEIVAVQDYPHIEHVIVNDDLRIGAKRNLACERAKGEIILHMDDDDLYSNDWVSRCVKALHNCDITGIDSAYFYDYHSKECYLYKGEDNYIIGATMCYRKSFWHRNRFDEIQVGEDNRFLKAKDAIVKPFDYRDGFLSLLHSGNTSVKPLWHRYFRKLSNDEIDNVPLVKRVPASYTQDAA